MKILVTGSRNWTDADPIMERLEELPYPWESGPYGSRHTLLHGDARGADRIAAEIAGEMGWIVEPYPADWQSHGRRAGYLRNVQMLDQAPDLVLAFQRNGSRGTQHTIDEARKRGIPVEVYTA